jgi:hypothetical protein
MEQNQIKIGQRVIVRGGSKCPKQYVGMYGVITKANLDTNLPENVVKLDRDFTAYFFASELEECCPQCGKAHP